MQELTCNQLKKRVRQLEKIVSDRRRQDAFLRQTETRYRNLFDQAADAIVVFDPRTLAFEDFNDEACRMLGYSRKEFSLLRLSDINAIESAKQLVQHGSKIPTHKVVVCETRQRTKAGALLDVEIRTRAFQADGRRLIQGVWRNITERKRADEALRLAADEWQTTFDTVGDAIFLLDDTQRVQRANRAAARLFRMPIKKMLGLHCWEFVHGGKKAIPDCPFRRMATSGRREGMELAIGKRWYHVTADPLRDAGGKLRGAVHIVRDITERKRTEAALRRLTATLETRVAEQTAALRQSEARLLRVIEGSNDGYWEFDLSADRVNLSPRCREILRLPPDREAVSQDDVWRFIHPADAARVRETLASCMAKSEGVARCELDHRVRNGDGTVWVSARVMVTQRDTAGNVLRLSGMMTDITERKRMEEEIRRRSQQLARLAAELTQAEQKERWRLALVLHEDLQQRLGSILFKIQMASADEKRPAFRRTMDKLAKEAQQAIDLTRSLSKSLFPPVLHQFGLRDGLEWLAKELMTQYGLSVRLLGLRTFKLPSADIRDFAFDAVRELLTNVRKHAGVRAAEIRIRRVGKQRIAIDVLDKGTCCAVVGNSGSHFGLFSIRERSAAFGAEFAILSARGKGTCATLTLPTV